MKFIENAKKLNGVDLYQVVLPMWLRDGNYPKYRFVDYAEIVGRHRRSNLWTGYDSLKRGIWDYPI